MLNLLAFTASAHKERWDENREGWSPLMRAVYYGQTSKYLKLIEEGADLNFVSSTSESNWHLTALEVAIFKDNEVAVRILLETNKISKPGTHLMTAAGQKSALNVERLLRYGANPNDTLDNGYSVLMMAASFGSFDVFETLLRHGAKTDQTRKIDGMTALMLAAFNGQPKKVKLLLDYGANKSRKTATEIRRYIMSGLYMTG